MNLGFQVLITAVLVHALAVTPMGVEPGAYAWEADQDSDRVLYLRRDFAPAVVEVTCGTRDLLKQWECLRGKLEGFRTEREPTLSGYQLMYFLVLEWGSERLVEAEKRVHLQKITRITPFLLRLSRAEWVQLHVQRLIDSQRDFHSERAYKGALLQRMIQETESQIARAGAEVATFPEVGKADRVRFGNLKNAWLKMRVKYSL